MGIMSTTMALAPLSYPISALNCNDVGLGISYPHNANPKDEIF